MKNVIKILILLISNLLYAQLDTIHYIQPLIYANYTNTTVQYEYLYLSTPSEENITVEITAMDGVTAPSFGYTGGVSKVDNKITFSNSTPVRITLSSSVGTSLISRPISLALKKLTPSTSGMILKSKDKFFANYRAIASSNGHALSSLMKGTKAIGKNFYWGGIPAHLQSRAADFSYSLTITALEDNTKVTISGLETIIANNTVLGVVFTNGETTWSPASTTITTDNLPEGNLPGGVLSKGESIVFKVMLKEGPNNDNGKELQRKGWYGAKITSTNNILVSAAGLLHQGNVASNKDMALEQIIPIDLLGTNHILMKGLGTTRAGQTDAAKLNGTERAYVIATERETEVYVNGKTWTTLKEEGDFTEIQGYMYEEFGSSNMHIRTSKKAYVFQKIFGSGGAMTSNFILVPPLGCNGQSEVNLIPDATRVGNTNFPNTTIFVLAQAGNDFKPTVTRNGTVITPSSDGDGVNTFNNSYKVYKYIIGDGTSTTANNFNIKIISKGPIQVQALGASGNAGFGGYYSGFDDPLPLPIESDNNRFIGKVCTGNTGASILKSTIDENSAKFQWYKDEIKIEGATSSTYKIPDTDTEPAIYKIKLIIDDRCEYFTQEIQTEVCPCSKEPNKAPGVLYPGIVGVSTTENTDANWPNNINNAFLTLKSNDKGLVITRNADPETTIAEPVVGMIVYDTDDNCYKLFDGTIWKCLRKKCYDYDN